jgi:uncharacterized protein YdaU (DUF1376 family)
MNYYRRYMADYLSKTANLSLSEHGAYTLLLDYSYLADGVLPGDVDELCRMVRAITPSERQAVTKILNRFFVLGGGQYSNPRAAREIEKAKPAMDAARANGLKGGRPKNNPPGFDEDNPPGLETEPSAKASQPLTPNHQPPAPIHQPLKKEKASPASRSAPARRKVSMPSDFSVSTRVSAWATEKGYDRLDEHLESFRLKCAAKDYQNIDWDAAFMEAVRKDWAGLRNGSAAPVQSLSAFMEERDRRATN